jgi:N-acetyl sugar amidotransferase
MQQEKVITYYGLPAEVRFCRKCLMSNQRPSSVPEFKNSPDHKKQTLHFDEQGICDACRYAEMKDTKVDWNVREKELDELCDRYRRDDGYYDVLVPGSGGKDSCVASHVLKYKYGMHPLTCTWPPHIYTDIGWKNFKAWLDVGGFDNVSFSPNGKVHRLLTKLAVENLFHPFQPFIIGQKNIAPKLALKYDIKLIFYGENEAEYGNPIADNKSAQRDVRYYGMSKEELKQVFLGGVSIDRLMKEYGLNLNDLEPYLPADAAELQKKQVDVRYLGYYIKWTPQENYYYSVEHTGFEANPERTEGTFSKYNSLDDKIDGFHYWTTYIKFGLGRTSYEASQEIRNHHLTREEGIALVNRFDGEFPQKYFKEILEYMGMTEQRFFELADKFRSPHLWEKSNGEWRLKHKVS